MNLPKVDQPTFEITIPSTKKIAKYRPFLMKEEKILMMGLEGNDPKSIGNSIKQIIQNCTFGDVDVNSLTSFDLEYFFLKLRSKSVAETVDLQFICPDCDKKTEFTVDLNNIEITENENHTNKIELSDSVGIVMNYPSIEDIIDSSKAEDSRFEIDVIFDLIIGCIDYVYDNESIHKRKDGTNDEWKEWLEGLSQDHFIKIRDFFDTMPKLTHTENIECKSCGNSQEIKLEGIQNFFTSGSVTII